MKDERPKSRSRVETKWTSTIFEAPLADVQEKPRKIRIGQKDAGVEGLFGKEEPEFQQKNQNLVMGSQKP
jgi:hypothetical protein